MRLLILIYSSTQLHSLSAPPRLLAMPATDTQRIVRLLAIKFGFCEEDALRHLEELWDEPSWLTEAGVLVKRLKTPKALPSELVKAVAEARALGNGWRVAAGFQVESMGYTLTEKERYWREHAIAERERLMTRNGQGVKRILDDGCAGSRRTCRV